MSMVNHWYDEEARATRCREHEGDFAYHISSNDRVSCNECMDLLTPDERDGQWYLRDDDADEQAEWPPGVVEMTREAGAIYYTLSDAPTDPQVCTCHHGGLGMMWHLRPCPVAEALWTVRGVLA